MRVIENLFNSLHIALNACESIPPSVQGWSRGGSLQIIKNNAFNPWGRQNGIPDVKTINKSLVKFKKDHLGVEIKS